MAQANTPMILGDSHLTERNSALQLVTMTGQMTSVTTGSSTSTYISTKMQELHITANISHLSLALLYQVCVGGTRLLYIVTCSVVLGSLSNFRYTRREFTTECDVMLYRFRLLLPCETLPTFMLCRLFCNQSIRLFLLLHFSHFRQDDLSENGRFGSLA